MTGYMAEMRKLVGHRTLIQCAASIIVLDEENRVLMGQRSDNKLWGYSGGAVEIDEYVTECAKRELYEEMGLVADELELFYINSGPEAHYIYPNGDEVSNFEIIYLCRKWHGEPTARDGEMLDLRFFTVDEIDLSEISPPIRPVVRELIRKLKNQAAGKELTYE